MSLAYKSDLLPIIFDKKELKKRNKCIEKLVNGKIIEKATSAAIEAIQTAAMIVTSTVH
ncbi:MAG TPA: hypothetical protein VKA08_19085 [Balneolales bacterium]|nr:hypothetical protein [Balneolales bacterium]